MLAGSASTVPDRPAVLLMDGAMGTELQKLGLPIGESSPPWNLTHPDAVRAVHLSYLAAGARVLVANTFPTDDPDEFRAGVALAREVAPPGVRVLASVAPVDWPGPYQMAELAAELADGVLLETWSSRHVRPVLSASAGRGLLSIVYMRLPTGQLVDFNGKPPEWFAERVEDWGAAALGVNCGTDIDIRMCAEVLRRYRRVTALPLFARPNAGTPTRTADGWQYPRTPALMAAEVNLLVEAGATMLGGCCGTTPEHIRAFAQRLGQ
jgi:methionine synthase I (cobalamin-dependent)